jgi:hypothetical protein
MAMRNLKTTMTEHCLHMLDYQNQHLISHGNTRNNTEVFPLKKLFFRGLPCASVTGLFFSKCHFAVTVFLVLLLTTQSLWADVRASLNRQTIYEGDSVSLNIITDETGRGADPDLSVLQQDFDILGTASSQQTSIINGKRSESHQWNIELAPKHAGELTVPPIRVGADTTQALTLQVTAQPDAVVAEAGQPVFMKTQLQPLDAPVYVQQQLRYTLQLFYRESLFEGSFDGPHVEHALVERLGEDVQYKSTVNGVEYNVVERHFAIFPEQSGTFTISPVTFNGRLAGQSQQRMPSMFMDDMMERFFSNTTITTPGKRIRLRSEGYTLDVQPRAAAFTGDDWLPSEWVIGSRQLTVAYVPSAAGMLTIPAMHIDWWDTTVEQQKTVELPSWTVNVLPGDGLAEPPPASPVTSVTAPDEPPGVSVADTDDWLEKAMSRWPWLLAGLVLLAAMLFIWRRNQPRGVTTPVHNAEPSSRQQLRAARSAVQQACQGNNPAAAANALLQWAAASWPDDPPRNLGTLMQQLSTGVNEIQALEQALYSAAGQPWQGEALWRVFEKGLEIKQATGAPASAGLSPLYPDWKT